MSSAVVCPICQNANGAFCREEDANGKDCHRFNCEACGQFDITGSAFKIHFSPGAAFTDIQRAALSYQVRTATDLNSQVTINTNWLERFLANPRLPPPPEQATNLIRIVGNHMAQTGDDYEMTVATPRKIGSLNWIKCRFLFAELRQAGLIFQVNDKKVDGATLGSKFYLTLDGWKLYEREKAGRFSGKYGFVALQFNSANLDDLIDNVVRLEIRKRLNYDLVDMRTSTRAGIIDNIMRQMIRDSAFVIADLSHDNSGAYWEAGFAEGLGKQVIYICEKSKFESKKRGGPGS